VEQGQAYEDDLIFDVGLHKGQDTDFYLRKGFRVVAIDAAPTLVEAAAQRFAPEIESGQLNLVAAAIADRPGPVVLHLNENSHWNTTQPSWSQRNARMGFPESGAVEVQGVTFDSLVQRFGVPYYLKIDIEGADMLCLEGLNSLAVPRYVSIESDKLSWAALLHEFDVLEALGYNRFKVVPQHKVRHQAPPVPAREGRHVDYTFEHMSSGMFGEEAPGQWLTRRQALARYRLIFARYRMWGENTLLFRSVLYRPIRKVLGPAGWYDTHATQLK
jgi:FkbM family methyltransferase